MRLLSLAAGPAAPWFGQRAFPRHSYSERVIYCLFKTLCIYTVERNRRAAPSENTQAFLLVIALYNSVSFTYGEFCGRFRPHPFYLSQPAAEPTGREQRGGRLHGNPDHDHNDRSLINIGNGE